MAYCKHCGAEINDGAAFCPKCGQAQSETAPQQQTPPNWQQPPQTPAPVDSGSIGWGVLGFFFPLIGLILYLVWQNTMPLRARMCGKGALIGVIAEVALAVIGYIIVIILMAALLSVA